MTLRVIGARALLHSAEIRLYRMNMSSTIYYAHYFCISSSCEIEDNFNYRLLWEGLCFSKTNEVASEI